MKTLARLVYLAAAVLPFLAADDENSCRDDQWQCKSGGKCIWKEEHCNGKLDCPDSSDESADCVKDVSHCLLPPYPEHGNYQTDVQGEPGDSFSYLTLNVTCDVGYKTIGEGSVSCFKGWWQQLIPSCAYAGECGVIPANSTEQTGASKRSQMPWHVDFYDKVLDYRHICSGTLIRDDAVITLAFCFLNIYPEMKPIPVEETVALAGNQNREWNSPDELPFVQKSGVKQIFLANYNTSSSEVVKLDDLAIIILMKPFVYNAYIRPVCINFDVNFDRLQLQPGRKGKFPAWGFSTNEVDQFKPTFDVVDFTLVDSEQCILATQEFLRKNNFVLKPEQTICTEHNQSVLYQCLKGYDDTGSGLVYPQSEPEGTQRYYLRGVLWRFGNFVVSPNVCTPLEGYALFTRLQNYEAFVKRYFKQPGSVVDERLQSKKCTYPPYPVNGKYIPSVPKAKPGYSYEQDVSLNVICTDGYVVNAAAEVRCSGGKWSAELPKCVPKCHLKPHPSVTYNCVVNDGKVSGGTRKCKEFEPSGTQVKVECQPNYYSASTLKDMFCNEGEWSSIQKCTPECGVLTPNATELVLGGRDVQNVTEVPWHAGIYSKATLPYKHICGGSLISNNIVISAAHCFWLDGDGLLPASMYAVAMGKLYRRWDSPLDKQAQRFDVKELRVPDQFHGNVGHLQSDIAILVLNSSVEYKPYIRPVCINFDERFENQQLVSGAPGKVAGWGLISEYNETAARILQVVELPYVDYITCYNETPISFRAHITSDKICAGYRNAGTALCKGDSGGGLAFAVDDKGTLRYYLRGIVSEAPTSDSKQCNGETYTTFTRLSKFQDLIKNYWYD